MGVKGKNLNVFVRFGGLNLKKQEGYSNSPSGFHQPPAPRGFYAMPKVAQEFFLIGSLDQTQPEIFPKVPSFCDLTPEQEEEAWIKYSKRSNKVYEYIRKEFVLKNESNLWHHLYADNCDVLARHGSWVKTSFSTWKKCFSKESIKLRIESSEGNVNNTRGVCGYYSKDHFEVFIDEKI